ncbi:MAG: class I SAM-dependent methyltransferase [Xanthomonadales bacterium]|nr:class I SAM-dependent methyltransferase [Xanthomonadales bacterium]
MTNPTLEFTGERFTPECVREIWYEHQHRYAFARRWAAGRRVLDAACGEGYGSALLAADARSVLGLDIDDTTVAHAQARYGATPRLRFQCMDVTRLDALDTASADLVVSFETLEHLEAHDALLDGFARVLDREGVLIISTPDKANYSDRSGFRNEFHVRELYRHEFETLLRNRFEHVDLVAQKLLFQSVLWRPDLAGSAAATTMQGDAPHDTLDHEPMYWVAVCSHNGAHRARLPAVHLFGDADESVYAHYNHEIRKNMSAGARIAELEAEVASLKQRLDER